VAETYFHGTAVYEFSCHTLYMNLSHKSAVSESILSVEPYATAKSIVFDIIVNEWAHVPDDPATLL
jgi:hypothetical protein